MWFGTALNGSASHPMIHHKFCDGLGTIINFCDVRTETHNTSCCSVHARFVIISWIEDLNSCLESLQDGPFESILDDGCHNFLAGVGGSFFLRKKLRKA
jgi:hypothetical protein